MINLVFVFENLSVIENCQECDHLLSCLPKYFFVFIFKDFILLIFRGVGEREIPMCGCLSRAPCWGSGCNPGLCPDWESNPDPLIGRLALNPLSHTSQGTKCV